MNDLERKLIEFMKDEASGAEGPVVLPAAAQRRVRRRQVRNAALTGIAAVAVVSLFAAGLATFAPLGKDRQRPTGPGVAGSTPTTATLSYAGITYPGNWNLVEMQGLVELYSGPDIQPVLQLTNWETDATATATPALCWGPSMPEQPQTGVALVVLAGGGGADGPGLEPGSLEIGNSEVGATCSDEAVGPTAHAEPTAIWVWNGVTYRAFAWANEGATEADKAALLDSFRSLVAPAEAPRVPARELESPADVLFAGDTGQETWRVVSYPSPEGERPTMDASPEGGTTMELRTSRTYEGGMGSEEIISTSALTPTDGKGVRLELGFLLWPADEGGPGTSAELGPAVLYGMMGQGIDTIEVRAGTGPTSAAQRRPLPAYGNGWEAFAIPMESLPLDGSVVVIDASGKEFSIPLDSLAVFVTSKSFSDDDLEGAAHWAQIAADTWFADHGTFEGFTPQEASKIDPSLNWTDPTMSRRGDTVDITVVTPDSILLNAHPKDPAETVFCAAHTPEGSFVEATWATRIADCTPEAAAQARLRIALAAAKVFFTDGDTYAGLTPEKATAIEPSVTFNASPDAVEGEVSIRDASTDTILLVTRASDGSVFCIGEDPQRFAGQPGNPSYTVYGTGIDGDPQTAAGCLGGFTNEPGG